MEIGDKLDILYKELGKEKYESFAKVIVFLRRKKSRNIILVFLHFQKEYEK